MKFSMSKKALVAELGVWVAMAAKKSPKPILMHGYLEALQVDGVGKLKLLSTDETMQYAGECLEGVSVQESGKCVVPAKDLFDIVKSFPENCTIQLENDSANKTLRLSSGKIKFSLCGLDPEEFPTDFSQVIPKNKNTVWGTCAGALFLSFIEKTKFAIATEEFRYNLCGLFCEYRTKTDVEENDFGNVAALRMVATDGHRLALAEFGEYDRVASTRKLIPAPMIHELQRVLTGWKGNISFCLEGRVLAFQLGGKTLTTYPVEGEFPEYASVIPSLSPVCMTIHREELLGAFRRITLLSNEKDGGTAWKFSPQQIEVASVDAKRGDANQQIDVTEYVGGSGMEIGVLSRYVSDLLSSMEEENVRVEISSPMAPILIKPVDVVKDTSNEEGSTGEIKATEPKKQHLGVVMPRRL